MAKNIFNSNEPGKAEELRNNMMELLLILAKGMEDEKKGDHKAADEKFDDLYDITGDMDIDTIQEFALFMVSQGYGIIELITTLLGQTPLKFLEDIKSKLELLDLERKFNPEATDEDLIKTLFGDLGGLGNIGGTGGFGF